MTSSPQVKADKMPPQVSPVQQWPVLLSMLAVVCGFGFIANWIIWRDIASIAWRDEEQSQVLLAPIVFTYLMWLTRHRFNHWRVHGRWVGLPILMVAWGMRLLGDINAWESVWHGSAVFTLIGCVVVVLGVEVFRRFWFCWPVALLLIPVPGVIRWNVSMPLQLFTAQIAQVISVAIGLHVERFGNLLTINGAAVTVAEACSGLRMVYAIGLISWALAFSSRVSWKTRVLILVLSPLFAVIVNVIRVVPTLWVYGFADIETADMVHDMGGWIMLAMSFVLPKMILARYESTDHQDAIDIAIEREAEAEQARRTAGVEVRTQSRLRNWAAAVLALLAIGAIGIYTPSYDYPETRHAYFEDIRELAMDIPYQIGFWVGQDQTPQEAAIRLLHPNVIFERMYTNTRTGDRMSMLFVHCKDVRDMQGHYPPICYPNQGWALETVANIPLTTAWFDFSMRSYNFAPQRGEGSQLVVYNFFIMPDGSLEGTYRPVRLASADPSQRFHGAAQVQFVFYDSTPIEIREQTVQMFVASMSELFNQILKGPYAPQYIGSQVVTHARPTR